MAAGVVVTVIGDLALIPRFGALGAAIASTLAYFVIDVALLGSFWWIGRKPA
jgi:hypothetical protein